MKHFDLPLNRDESSTIENFLRHLNRHIEANRRIRIKQSKSIVRYENPLELGDLSIFRNKKVAMWREEIVQLSPIQFNLVNIISDVPGNYISIEVLIDALISRNMSVYPKTIIRDVVDATRRKFLSVDPNFDKIQYSNDKGCVWV